MNITYTKATLDDILAMQTLVQPYVDEGTILARTDNEVANTIRSYIIAKDAEIIVGFAALYLYSTKLAEIRTLVVKPAYQSRGIGAHIVRTLLEEANALHVQEVLSLTFKADFFKGLGFTEISKEAIPDHKVWEDCIRCKLFPTCNEIALIKQLS
jgi:amino-acid N-acetyltransferase